MVSKTLLFLVVVSLLVQEAYLQGKSMVPWKMLFYIPIFVFLSFGEIFKDL